MPTESIQEVGEELATMLGVALEIKKDWHSLGRFAVKQLPDEKTLLVLLELAKEAEQKAKELGEMGDAFAQKWQRRLEARQATKQEQ